jgi:hypothetical protein
LDYDILTARRASSDGWIVIAGHLFDERVQDFFLEEIASKWIVAPPKPIAPCIGLEDIIAPMNGLEIAADEGNATVQFIFAYVS